MAAARAAASPSARRRRKRAQRSLLASRPTLRARRSTRAPSRRHHRARADRDRHLPRRRRLPALGGRGARRRRGRRRRGSCSGRSAMRCRSRSWSAARSCSPRELRPPARPMRTGVAVPDGRAHAGARGGHARARSRAGRRRTQFWQCGVVRVARRHRRAGGAVGRLASDLDARRAHPRGVPVHRRADPRLAARRSRRSIRADRRGRGRHGPRAAALDRGALRVAAGARHRAAPRPATAAARSAALSSDEPEPLLPPEPDTAELVVRATHVEAPPIEASSRGRADGRRGARADERRDPDGRRRRAARTFATTSRPGAAIDVRPEDLTPQGRYRASITDDPDFEWRVPVGALPDPLDRRGGQARHRRPGAGRQDAASRRSATSGSRRR